MFLLSRIPVTHPQSAIQVHQRLFNPMQCVSSFQSASTGIFELASFPHVYFDLAYFFLELEEEVRGFTKPCDLGGEGQVADVFESRFELIEVVSAKLESPEVILGIPWALSLIMVRDCIQWSSIL